MLVLLKLLYLDIPRLQLQPLGPRRLPEFDGSIRSMKTRQSTAGNHVLCWKTSSPAGGNSVQPASLSSAPPLASVPEEICCASLIFQKDILSDREFLVDSDASVSVFPGLELPLKKLFVF